MTSTIPDPVRRAVTGYLAAALWHDSHALVGGYDPFDPPPWTPEAIQTAAEQIMAVYEVSQASLAWPTHAEMYGARLWQEQRRLAVSLTDAGAFTLTPVSTGRAA